MKISVCLPVYLSSFFLWMKTSFLHFSPFIFLLPAILIPKQALLGIIFSSLLWLTLKFHKLFSFFHILHVSLLFTAVISLKIISKRILMRWSFWACVTEKTFLFFKNNNSDRHILLFKACSFSDMYFFVAVISLSQEVFRIFFYLWILLSLIFPSIFPSNLLSFWFSIIRKAKFSWVNFKDLVGFIQWFMGSILSSR